MPLDLEFYIGLPPEIPDDRLAKVKTLSRWRGLLALRHTPPALTLKMIRPGSLLRRSYHVLAEPSWNDRRSLEVELPAGNGVGTARAIARAYSAFAEGGVKVGLTAETLARVTAPPSSGTPIDDVMGVPSYFSLGFMRPGPEVAFGSSPRAFGAPGAGGSFAFADPDAGLAFGYVMNQMQLGLAGDARSERLVSAAYACVAASKTAS